MRVCVCVVCLLIFAVSTACTEDDKLKVETKKNVVARKCSSADGTFNVPGDITSLTIN